LANGIDKILKYGILPIIKERLNMTFNQSNKILKENGIHWSNYFELDYILKNMDQESNSNIVNAINWMKVYLITGKGY